MPNSIVESDANKVEVDSITIAPTIAITDVTVSYTHLLGEYISGIVVL